VTPTEQAAAKRLRRILAKDGQRLCIPRGEQTLQQLGIHVVDDRNCVVASHCSIEGLLAEVG